VEPIPPSQTARLKVGQSMGKRFRDSRNSRSNNYLQWWTPQDSNL